MPSATEFRISSCRCSRRALASASRRLSRSPGWSGPPSAPESNRPTGARPVAVERIAQGKGRRPVVGGQMQTPQELMHRLVVQRDGPAGVAPGPRRRVVYAASASRAMATRWARTLLVWRSLLKGHSGKSDVLRTKGEIRVLLGIEDAEVCETRDGRHRRPCAPGYRYARCRRLPRRALDRPNHSSWVPPKVSVRSR